MRFGTLTTVLVAIGVGAAGAAASIVATLGSAVHIAPPASSAVGALESNTEIFVWDEKQNVALPVNMPLDIDGTPGLYNGPGTLTGGALGAGTIVNSHFIHFDQVGPGATALFGGVDFDSPIIGVQLRGANLDAGDVMGVGTVYPTGFAQREVDWFPGGPVEEIRISADRKRIEFFLVTSNALDQIRVFTDPFGGALATDKCHLSWDVPCCATPIGQGLAKTTLTICNCDTSEDKKYFFSMVADDPGLSFAPDQGYVIVPAGGCVDIPIEVWCSPNIPVGQGGAFHANVANLSMGGVFRCDGSVRQTGTIKIVAPNPVITAVVGERLLIPFNVFFPPGQQEPLMLFFEAMPSDSVDLPMPQMTIDPPIGNETGILIGLLVPAVQKVREADLRAPGDFLGFSDVIVSWDQDGDGQPEAGVSATLKAVEAPCFADLNGDGVISGADLGLLLGAWGPCQ